MRVSFGGNKDGDNGLCLPSGFGRGDRKRLPSVVPRHRRGSVYRRIPSQGGHGEEGVIEIERQHFPSPGSGSERGGQ